MIGLKRGTVELISHQEEWDKNARNIIGILKQLLGNTAVDIQHIGSSSISTISSMQNQLLILLSVFVI